MDAVLVSHAHIDHTGYISFLREDIPIYSTAMTAFIAKAMQDSGIAELEKEVCYFAPREADPDYDIIRTTRDWRKIPYVLRPFVLVDEDCLNDDARAFWRRKPGTGRGLDCRECDSSRDCVGGLRVRSYPVDHSVYGACAWAVETSAGWVVYTGDLRLHGSRGGDDASLHRGGEGAAAAGADLRGDASGRGEGAGRADDGERRPGERAARRCVTTDGLVVADFGPRNVERLCTFLEVARATGRKLVILAKDAFLLDVMRMASPEVPTLESSPELLVYRT